MKSYLKIQSNGEIEIEAFTLIGASSKRNDESKIGYFGSGLKYSIAAMLRNNIDFKIFNGEKEILFTTNEKNFRKEVYQAITVNGQETSLTITMGGSDWDNPFAPIREIYSNALDEDEDATLSKTDQVAGEAGKTTFFIEYTEGVKHFFDNYNLYFSNKIETILHVSDFATIFPPNQDGDLRLYRKGILCQHRQHAKAMFNYNSQYFTINESRVLDNDSNANYNIAAAWKHCDKENLIRDLIQGLTGSNTGFYEHDLYYSTSKNVFSSAWYNLLKDGKYVPVEMVSFCSETRLKGRTVLPLSLLKPLHRQFEDLDILGLTKGGNEIEHEIVEDVSQILIDKVVDAMTFLGGTRYKYRLKDINIEYVKFRDASVLGRAKEGIIYLSTKLDTYDVNAISKIIMEENEHNITGFGDKTRHFQNHLFDLYFDELVNRRIRENEPAE